jgi:hypothetical protein
VEKLQRFARPASSIRPETAAAACASQEHRAFLETLLGEAGMVERRHDPTEWRAAT